MVIKILSKLNTKYMFSQLLIPNFRFYFIIILINVSSGLEEIFKDAKRISDISKRYQKGKDGASTSNRFDQCRLGNNDDIITNSSSNLGEDEIMFNRLSKRLRTNILEETSNVIQYFQEGSQINQPNQVPCKELEKSHFLNETKPVDIIPTPAPRLHKLIRVEGKSSAVRKHCMDHWANTKKRRNVMTKCDTCDEMMCEECHRKRHNLPISPRKRKPGKPRNLGYSALGEQICSHCNETILNDSETLLDHTRFCDKIPHSLKNGPRLLYSCYADGCVFMTDDRGRIRSHIRKHTGEKPFICNICENRYTSKDNRDKHVIKKHTNENN